jgi:hypothetical protein
MRRVSTIVAVTGVTVALIAPAAGAATTTGWQPYRTKPFDATNDCSFTIHGDIVKDQEEVRTDATYPDGSPKVQEYRGPLVIRFTNTSNGRSVVRDVSGYAALYFKQDGGSIWYFDGGGSIGVPIGNKAYPSGSYILQGTFVLTLAADGTRDLHPVQATVENLCTTLA